MDAIFLSASVPQLGRGDFYKTANPYLIQCAVRELLVAILGRRLLVWGGHPAITPMVWAACEDLGVSFANSVVLYQSTLFQSFYPKENEYFQNIVYIEKINDDRAASLLRMREAMLGRPDLVAAVFIGGMEGVLDEHALFVKRHPKEKVLAVPGPGGAARDLAAQLGTWDEKTPDDLNFARMFYDGLSIGADEVRKG
jgi:hypothetical protein